MQFTGNNYYSAMDYLGGNSHFEQTSAPEETDAYGNSITPDDALNFTPKEIGTTTNPMTGQVEALKARIREGASRIEFSFLGAGKGNAQRPTPESFGTKERREIRELLNANEMTTSTHAPIHSESLAGFSNEGFNSVARAQVLKEIKRAIHFAGEATKGGAIVFHLNEWQRPMSEINKYAGAKFKGYDSEDKDAVLFAVDDRTGQSAGGIRKDQEIFRPVFKTAKEAGIAGKTDSKGNLLEERDWIDIHGNKIARDAPVTRLFDRVPIFQEGTSNFQVKKLNFDDIKAETEEWNQDNPDKDPRTPAEMMAILQLENNVLQAKGNSLYHAKEYSNYQKDLKKLLEKKKIIEVAKKGLPENEHWKLRNMYAEGYRAPDKDEDPDKWLQDQIRHTEHSMRYIHESSAQADVLAKQAEENIKHIKSAEKYGLQKTAETVAGAGIEAMEVWKRNKDKYGLKQPIYAAPENWDPRQFGSHPEEYRKVIDKSRKVMAKRLIGKGYSESQAKDLAKAHIKGTLDIGHMNLWRSYFQAKDGETPEQAEKRFDKWIVKEADKLVKEGYAGHIHLTDNFGYDDEHLTPGQGNVPMQKFMKNLEEAGIKDIIVEQGSYNPLAHIETLELINSPIYGVGRKQRFRQVHQAGFGYNAPGFFVAGSYVPSNDWKPWTDIPLE